MSAASIGAARTRDLWRSWINGLRARASSQLLLLALGVAPCRRKLRLAQALLDYASDMLRADEALAGYAGDRTDGRASPAGGGSGVQILIDNNTGRWLSAEALQTVDGRRMVEITIGDAVARDYGLMVGGIWILCPFCGRKDPEIEVHGHSQCRHCTRVIRRCCDD